MQFHEMNIASLIARLLEKEVDFDTLHGLRPQGGTRVAVIVNLTGGSYRVNLGDKKHGNLISGIHKEDDHTSKISLDDLLAKIDANEVKNEWRLNTLELRTRRYENSGNPVRFNR